MVTSPIPALRDVPAPIAIRKIDVDDLKMSLRAGLDDFLRRPSHYVFLAFVYPVMGIIIALFATSANAFPILFPLVAGFALLGPIAALGFYEISRREEAGDTTTWTDAFHVLRSPSFPAIIKVALVLCAIFVLWLVSAQALFSWLVPDVSAGNYVNFVSTVFESEKGWTLIIIGNLLGLLFAVVAFSLSVISLPLILDRHVGAMQALETSVHAVRENIVPMVCWGLLTAALLILGSLPLLVGLAVILPVMGHATWHLYRRVIV